MRGITAVSLPPLPLSQIRYSQIVVFLYPRPRDPLSPSVAGVDSCDIRSRVLFPRPSAGMACRPTVQRASSCARIRVESVLLVGDGEGGREWVYNGTEREIQWLIGFFWAPDSSPSLDFL